MHSTVVAMPWALGGAFNKRRRLLVVVGELEMSSRYSVVTLHTIQCLLCLTSTKERVSWLLRVSFEDEL